MLLLFCVWPARLLCLGTLSFSFLGTVDTFCLALLLLSSGHSCLFPWGLLFSKPGTLSFCVPDTLTGQLDGPLQGHTAPPKCNTNRCGQIRGWAFPCCPVAPPYHALDLLYVSLLLFTCVQAFTNVTPSQVEELIRSVSGLLPRLVRIVCHEKAAIRNLVVDTLATFITFSRQPMRVFTLLESVGWVLVPFTGCNDVGCSLCVMFGVLCILNPSCPIASFSPFRCSCVPLCLPSNVLYFCPSISASAIVEFLFFPSSLVFAFVSMIPRLHFSVHRNFPFSLCGVLCVHFPPPSCKATSLCRLSMSLCVTIHSHPPCPCCLRLVILSLCGLSICSSLAPDA